MIGRVVEMAGGGKFDILVLDSVCGAKLRDFDGMFELLGEGEGETSS
jgi:hypothetical protein